MEKKLESSALFFTKKKEWNYYIMDNFGIQKLRTSRLKVGTLFATESAQFKDKKTDKYFFFFSSHFDHVSNEARVNSAKLLVQKVQEIAGDLPYFCTGDLNCDPDEEPISFILNSGLFKDSYSISETTPKGPAGTLHYWNFDFNPEHRIDYILVEKSIKVLSFETITDDARQGRFSSDHYPIMIKAEL